VKFSRWLFRLLYNRLAWTYDWVSWVVSLGKWRHWQRAAIPRLTGKRVLEIAFGTGNLLIDLPQAGYRPYGLELSPYMVRIAGRKLQQRKLAVPLCLGRVQMLPFAHQTFDSVVATFPTDYIYDPAFLIEVERVLRQSGTLVIIPGAYFHNPLARFFVEWLYLIAGQRGSRSTGARLFDGTGMSVRYEEDRDRTSAVQVIVLTKKSREEAQCEL
jgi:ubiquinone/menaquinone biosynthesis C-methylase UbiE